LSCIRAPGYATPGLGVFLCAEGAPFDIGKNNDSNNNIKGRIAKKI
jgi:hypothetical protein